MADQSTSYALLSKEDALKTDIHLGSHSIIADEPEDDGGTDQGATPVELALGALASCTAMTVKLYLQHKKWPSADIRVDVFYDVELVKDKDSLTEEEQEFVYNSRLRKITKVVKVSGDFDADQQKRIKIIAGKCPVNQMMTGSCMVTDKVELLD